MVQQSPKGTCKGTPVKTGTPRSSRSTKQSWTTCGSCGIRTVSPHDCETPGVCTGGEGGVTKLLSTTRDTLYCHLHPDTMREMGVKIGTMVRVGEEVLECWTDPSVLPSQAGCALPDRTLVTLRPIDGIRQAATVQVKAEGALDTSYLPFLLQHRVIYPGQRLSLPYLSRSVVLRIEAVTATTQPDLSEALSSVSLSDQYYQVTTTTEFTETAPREVLPALLEANEMRSRVERIVSLSTGESSLFGAMDPPRTLVITGPSGTGKSLLCKTVLQASPLTSTIISDFSKKIAFESATRLLLLDGIDSVKVDDTVQIGTLTHLLSNIPPSLFVLATGCDVPPPLRKFFPIDLPMPGLTSGSRLRIFEHFLSLLPNSLSTDEVEMVATRAHGYVAADICNVCRLAVLLAEEESSDGGSAGSGAGSGMALTHLLTSLTRVTPRSMHEIRVEVPEVYWSQIGGLREVQELLTRVITWPITHAEQYKAMGITPPKGVLLYGPPGCCKTMMAKALATESGLNFLSVRGPELLSMYVGESERAVRELFARARTAAPAIVFFDEVDALAGERGASKGSGVGDRVLAQLLTELDGVVALAGVVVIAATNRPDRLDRALLRPGRLEKLVYVPLPDEECRREILEMKLARIPHAECVDVGALVAATEGFSGAEVVAVCHNAAISSIGSEGSVTMEMAMSAVTAIVPQTTEETVKFYDRFSKNTL